MMEKLKLLIKKQNYYVSILIIFILALLIIWFKDFKLIASGEDGLFLLNPKKALIIFDNLWIENGTGFSTTDWLPRIPFAYFISFLDLIGFSPFLSQSLIFFILMTTGTLSVFYLVRFIYHENTFSKELSFLSGLLYLFNPFSLTQLWNRQLYSQYFLFALLPLLLYLFIKGLEEKKYKFTFYFSVASLIFSTTFGLITNVIVIWSTIIIYSIIYGIKTKNISHLLKYLSSTLIVWVTCNLWWIIPFYINLQGDSIITSKINPIENLSTLRALSPYFRIENIIRLLQDYYFFKDTVLKEFYSNYFLQIFSFIAPSLILLNTSKVVKSKELRFFLIILLLGLTFSLGSNYPSGRLFEFFFINVSFLQAFRNPYEKYGIVYMLGYVVVLSYSLLFLFKNFKSKIVLIIFLTTWMYYLSPLIYGDRINVTKVSSPIFINDLSSINKDWKLNERITSLPLTGEGVNTNFGYSGVESSLYLFDNNFVSYRVNTPVQADYLNKLNEKIIARDNFKLQLSLLNSKYIFLRRDLVGEELFNESNLNERKLIDLNSIQNLNCKNITYEKNMIENKKVISCQVKEQNLGYIFLLQINIPINIPQVEINIIDTDGNRDIWRNPPQLENKNKTTTYLINSDLRSEKSRNFDNSKISFINIVLDKNVDINNLDLKSINFSNTHFKVIKTENNFVKLNSIPNYDVYELTPLNQPNHLGYIANIKKFNNLSEIFSLETISEELLNTSLVALSQNDYKSIDFNNIIYLDQNIEGIKISNEKYWIQNNKSQNNIQNIQLLNTYNSQWIILKDISVDNLQTGFINSLFLINKTKSSNIDYSHLTSNGYANLWQIKNSGDHKGYAIIYLPQIYKDLFIYISGFFFILYSSVLLFFKFFKK